MRFSQHQNICQAMVQYLQRTEIVDEHCARTENSRIMPAELLIEFESTTGLCIPENLKIYVQDREQKHSPRLTSVIRVMNKMIRDIAANNTIPRTELSSIPPQRPNQCYAIRHCEEAASVRIHRPAEMRQMEDHRGARCEADPRDRGGQLRHWDIGALGLYEEKRVSPDKNGMETTGQWVGIQCA